MDRAAMEQVAATLRGFHHRFAGLFGRWETEARSEQYVRGLLVQQTDRRNAENVAEVIEGATARGLQRLLTDAPWSSARVLDRLQEVVGACVATSDGVFVVDESGFPKQGSQSVGVKRQYCGALGKVANCQVGVFLAYVTPSGHALVDARLFLPEAWTDDPERCQAAGVPAGIAYQSKAALGLAMVRQAQAAGHLPGRWVTADEGYGEVPSFRDALAADGWCYVLEMPSTTPVFTRPAAVAVPTWSGRGRTPTRPRLVSGEASAQPVVTVAAGLGARAWHTLTVAEGAQGPRRSQFAGLRVWESREGLPGRESWLVLRRNLDGTELKYYLSNAPGATSLLTLGRVGAMRWSVETSLQHGKGETGLDEYEVRSWRGWHHHITLALLAGAFLLCLHRDWGEKSAPPDRAPAHAAPAGSAAPPPLDPHGLGALAGGHPMPQPPGQTVARQAQARHSDGPRAA